MIEDVGLCVDDDAQSIVHTLEVWRQNLHFTFWFQATNPADGGGKDGGTAILELITVHRGDDGVAQAHLLHGLSNALRLLPVQAERTPGLHGAEAAAPRADAAQDHKRSSFVPPALADIGATRLFADGVQRLAAHQLLEIAVVIATGSAHF